jgi:hypothetical protein
MGAMKGLGKRIAGRLKRLLDPAAEPAPREKGAVPDWGALVTADPGAWAVRENAPRVLVATAVGGHPVVTAIESLIAMALAARGAEVHVLLCDGVLTGCLEATLARFPDPAEFVLNGPKNVMCESCQCAGAKVFSPASGLVVHRMGELLSAAHRQEALSVAHSVPYVEIGHLRIEDVPVGEHAMAGALRYFSRGNLEGEPDGEKVLRKYLQASVLAMRAMQVLLEKVRFQHVTMNHGIYVPHGQLIEVARHKGIPVSTWCMAYRKRCVIFSHDDSYHHTMMSEPVDLWQNIEWTDELDKEAMDYLRSRWEGSNDWIWFHEHPEADAQKISRELNIDLTKPTIGLLTNVVWDAQLHFKTNAFPNMLDWLMKTIRYFEKRPDLQLVIRIHPAEIRGTVPSRQKAAEEIAREFPVLPPNVFVIPPESSVSTYAVMLQCNAVTIYGTKTGLELASFGVPVIVAGEAWIRNKGFSLDAGSEEEYYKILDGLPLADKRMSRERTQRARKYAYHFFFRRMIPIGAMDPTPGAWPPFKVNVTSAKDLVAGSDPGLDVICDGILKGEPFLYKAELETRELSAHWSQ